VKDSALGGSQLFSNSLNTGVGFDNRRAGDIRNQSILILFRIFKITIGFKKRFFSHKDFLSGKSLIARVMPVITDGRKYTRHMSGLFL